MNKFSSFIQFIKNYFILFLLFGLLVTFIVFIIQYMEGIKKNFLDINTLLIAYSAIFIIPFCSYLLEILKICDRIKIKCHTKYNNK